MKDKWVDEYVEKTLLKREVAHQGRIWDVVHDTFEIGKYRIARDYVRHMGAVAIVAVNENEELLTIRQYRQPVGAYLIEIPAGLLDDAEEEPMLAAQRELLEEAKCTATKWSVLIDFYTSPGSTSEAVRIFLAENVSAVESYDADLDDEESEIETKWVKIEDALHHVENGLWHSPTLIMGVFAYEALSLRRSVGSNWPSRSHLLETNRVHKLQ